MNQTRRQIAFERIRDPKECPKCGRNQFYRGRTWEDGTTAGKCFHCGFVGEYYYYGRTAEAVKTATGA